MNVTSSKSQVLPHDASNPHPHKLENLSTKGAHVSHSAFQPSLLTRRQLYRRTPETSRIHTHTHIRVYTDRGEEGKEGYWPPFRRVFVIVHRLLTPVRLERNVTVSGARGNDSNAGRLPSTCFHSRTSHAITTVHYYAT